MQLARADAAGGGGECEEAGIDDAVGGAGVAVAVLGGVTRAAVAVAVAVLGGVMRAECRASRRNSGQSARRAA